MQQRVDGINGKRKKYGIRKRLKKKVFLLNSSFDFFSCCWWCRQGRFIVNLVHLWHRFEDLWSGRHSDLCKRRSRREGGQRRSTDSGGFCGQEPIPEGIVLMLAMVQRGCWQGRASSDQDKELFQGQKQAQEQTNDRDCKDLHLCVLTNGQKARDHPNGLLRVAEF